MRLYFLVLLFFLLLEAKKQTPAPAGTPLVQCLECRARDGKCTRICEGFYCYKQEYTSSARGVIKVKRGCMNATDEGVAIGECQTTRSNLPGSDAQKAETLCICNSHKCNGSSKIPSLHSLLVGAFVIFFAKR
ncbi:unnamed protein product, partial [Mesorhabditis belari]|uniref:Uncharacterized protein n=1 Tax=Mesorhabditis belari TaxID=2138241 RepID=A0AAF3EGT8_9BILA